jgi:pantoate--beta-alanine ligase
MTASTIPKLVSTLGELRAALAPWRDTGTRIALIPTMGALHDGHLRLLREARAKADRIVISIFVNPAQFAPTEDFARYPRDLDGDRAKLAGPGGADLVYAPGTRDIYPDGFATKIVMAGPARGLESDFRPHFFTGVATVVAKLFLQCRPDFAFFGEKDYQQLLVVKRLAKDLDLGLEVVGVPTVRAADGLALSSRNAYLTPEARDVAGHLNRVLASVAARARASISIPQAEAEGAAALLAAGFERVDYVALRDAETLEPLHVVQRPARALAAARIGGVRLIDNVAV